MVLLLYTVFQLRINTNSPSKKACFVFWLHASRHNVLLKLLEHIVHTYFISWVGQNRLNTPYMTVYLVIFLPRVPYIHRIYVSGQP